MAEPNLKGRKRTDYVYFLAYRTRWSDNDQYSHINNSIYYHLFDSIVNTYLIEKCGLDPKSSPLIGLVVSSYCQYFAPLSFPQVLDLGLRVNKLGSSSVSYEIGVFEEGKDTPAAVGGYTHVFVGSESRKSAPMAVETKRGLDKLFRPLNAKLHQRQIWVCIEPLPPSKSFLSCLTISNGSFSVKVTPSLWTECPKGLSSPRNLATSLTYTRTNTLVWPTPRSLTSQILLQVSKSSLAKRNLLLMPSLPLPLHQPSALGRAVVVPLESPLQLPREATDPTCDLLPLHEFQHSSLPNGNPNQRHRRKSGERRRARSSLSDRSPYPLSSHLLYGFMHTCNILKVSMSIFRDT